jgi:glyoxylase-like metal-dependent hydrolase (beta-lactamase superfamily II)
MSLRQYASDVFGWSRYQPERGYEFNGTALPGSDGTVLLVDPVPAEPEELSALRKLGTRFVIVLLNGDHERDAARLSRELDAPVRVSALDAPAVKAPLGPTFQHGDTLPGGWVVQTLGAMKTAGESVLLHPAKRALVAGDAVINDPFTGMRLVPHAKLPDRAGALASLATVAKLDFDALYVGDGFHLPTGGRDALRRFLHKEGVTA